MFNRDNIQDFRKTIEAKLAEIPGLSCKLGTIRFDSEMGKCQLSFASVSNENSNVQQVNWNKTCRLYGLSPEDYNKFFYHGGTMYRTVEIAPRRSKFPIICVRMSDDQRIKFTALSIQFGLKNNPYTPNVPKEEE